MSRASAFLLCAAVFAAGCSQKAATEARDSEQLELVISADPRSFDPVDAGWVGNTVIQRQVLETLVEYDPDRPPVGIQGLLAEAWEVDADGLRWVFTLRSDARFHDPATPPLWEGREREVRASDVVWSWERLRNPALGADLDWALEPIDAIRALDDRRVEVRLHRRDSTFLQRVATQDFAVVPAELEQSAGRSYRDTPVGTAPYALAEWRPKELARFERIAERSSQDAAGREIARIPSLRFRYVKDPVLRTELFERGACARISPVQDAFTRMIPNGQLAPEYAERGIRLLEAAIPNVSLLVFNLDDPAIGIIPGDDEGNRRRRFLRRALAASFPREDWQSLVSPGGSGILARSFLPPQLPEANAGPAFPWVGGPEQAKQLLREGGWDANTPLPEIQFAAFGAKPVDRAVADLVAGTWEQAGFTVRVTQYPDFGAMQQAATRDEVPIMLRGWSLQWPEASLLLDLFDGELADSSVNLSRYRNDEFDRLLVEFRSAPAERRAVLVAQMCTMLNDEVPALPIEFRRSFVLAQPWLLDLRLHPFDPYPCKRWALAEAAG